MSPEQGADPVSQFDRPNGSSVRAEMQDSAAMSYDIESLRQEHGKMNDNQYGGGAGEMMLNPECLTTLAGVDSGQMENNATNPVGYQQPAVKLEYHGDSTAPLSLGGNCPVPPIDEGDSRLSHSNESANDSHGDAAVEREPDVEGENYYQDLSLDYLMDGPGHHDEAHSSTLQHTSEIPQDVTRDITMNDDSAFQGHDFADHTVLGEGEFRAEVHMDQDERDVTIPANERFVWPKGPTAPGNSFEKESQYAALQRNHEGVQPEQQYGGPMRLGTADQLLGPRDREMEQPSTLTRAADTWRDRGSMQSECEGNTVSTTEKETIGQHTQPTNAPLSDFWTTAGMNDILHQAFGSSIDFGNTSAPPHTSIRNTTPFMTSNTFSQFQLPTQHFASQQPLNLHNQSSANALLTHQQQLQAQVEQKKRQLENARRLHEQTQRQVQQVNSLGFAQNQTGVPASFLMGPLSYQRAPQSGYRQMPVGNNNGSHWPQMKSDSVQGQMALNGDPASYPTQGEQVVGKSIGVNRQTPRPSTAQDQSAAQQRSLTKEASDGNEEDDKPLMIRTNRHASITSQTSSTHQLSPTHPTAAHIVPIPTPSSPPPAPIDWKLPQYDIQVDPAPTDDPSQPTAKISLPGLVREEILLSPDHAEQEVHLLLNLFLPGQRALGTPDPQPAVAILNFHTIALMVIEAYVQYEIGDELGRRNPCYAPAPSSSSDEHAFGKKGKEEPEYERIRDARNADVDEIFFAVVDRWRAGRESGKQSLGLIRGVQEFCDVALDVIYYVKEHGLLRGGEQEVAEEKEMEVGEAEEGNKKGMGKMGNKEEGVAVLKAKTKAKPKGKRVATTEKAETGARKKSKVVAKKDEPKKRVRKPAGITVVKK